MLTHLLIRDFVIVDRIELEYSSGFGALTGETGAGKSILVDALALVLGERADAGVIRAGCERAEVVATFDISMRQDVLQWLAEHDLEPADDLLLRRVVDAGGRSRAYINGTTATVQQLREVGENLVDIHGQHAHQSLMRGDAQRQLLDGHAGLRPLVDEVAVAYRAWRGLERDLAELSASGEALLREREQLSWQVGEVDALALAEGEWAELESEHKRLAHAASLIEGAQFALGLLADDENASESQVDRAASRLHTLAEYDPALQDVAQLLQSVQAEIGEAVSTLRRYADRADCDPGRLAAIEGRIEAILSLARKYRCRPDELTVRLADWKLRLEELGEAADMAALTARMQAARSAYRELASRLSDRRRASAGELAVAVSGLMQQLALGSGRLDIALVPNGDGASHGLEDVEFRVSGLSGSEVRPLAKVVSGGELSRISLAIQVVTSRSASVPTLVFDEVDVGIGGGVAEIVGRLLHDLGRERQVLCVTHLPQVAARADWQWQVSKTGRDGAVLSCIRVLDADERVEEIARMLGGVEITGITRQHARELLGTR